MVNINKQEFFQKVDQELEALKIINKPHTDAFVLNMKKEREKNIQQGKEKVKNQLIEKIQSFNEIQPKYASLINGVIQNDFINRRDYSFVLGDIDLFKTHSIIHDNHYKKLEEEVKMELFEQLKNQIQRANFHPINEYFQHIQIFKGRSVVENENEFIQHFKAILTAYFKGYVLKDDVVFYLTEALPSVLWLIEKSQPKSLFAFHLLEYPLDQTTDETQEEFLSILKKWYQEKGKQITSFEGHLEEKIQGNDYKAASDIFYYYKYLFTEEFHREQEQILIDMLYNKYLEYQKIEDSVERSHRINDIRNELFHFVKE